MQTFDLNNLEEISLSEMNEINGGVILAVDCVVAALILTVPAVVGAVYLATR